jgi:hypothetical protein
MDNHYVCLACGCIVLGGRIAESCLTHFENQPLIGDPLYNYLANKGIINEENES